MKKNMTFEEAMCSLEDIVRRLESGNATLEESLASFEEAVALIKICNTKLESAEERVRILTEGKDGTITDSPFEINGNEN
ncbi:MAG: exodeoxyribonuclease VII small subunit [Clostridia bacterium]|nr:exodeoxyribonuclease VII small subunit [Clostridia bacterium]